METRSPVFPNWRIGNRDSAPESDPVMPATATVLCRNSRREVLMSAPCLERAYHRVILEGDGGSFTCRATAGAFRWEPTTIDASQRSNACLFPNQQSTA